MTAQSQSERSTAERVASAIVKSGFWKDANPNAVLMLCYLAEAEGHHPAVVYRDYHIMQGKPAKKAEAMLRDFIQGGGKIEWHVLDDECADATFSHPSGSARIIWTLERAKQAGIARNAMWSKYPRSMLRSRVVSEGVRTVYPGATSGLYEENEVADIVAESGNFAAPANETPMVAMEQEGHSQQGAVSPPAAKEYAFPEGPAKNITDLKNRCRPLWREIEGCGDAGELEPFLESEETKAILAQLEALENPTHRRELWTGDGKDNPGIEGLIARKRKLFDMQAISGGQYQEKEPA